MDSVFNSHYASQQQQKNKANGATVRKYMNCIILLGVSANEWPRTYAYPKYVVSATPSSDI